ncbi:MAG TPA: VOC family protein [Chloroflexota bacterium]|jgi:PhnB protein|nr:VOC family protein [Chloroflexota bacterium]
MPQEGTPFHLQIAPTLVVHDAVKAIEFYTEAFGAVEGWRLMHYHRVGHCVMHIGSSEFALLDEFTEAGILGPISNPPSGAGARLTLQVHDVDETARKAAALGATVTSEPKDLWWGVRSCSIVDPFGHRWNVMCKIEDVSPAEMQRRADEMDLYPPPKQPA